MLKEIDHSCISSELLECLKKISSELQYVDFSKDPVMIEIAEQLIEKTNLFDNVFGHYRKNGIMDKLIEADTDLYVSYISLKHAVRSHVHSSEQTYAERASKIWKTMIAEYDETEALNYDIYIKKLNNLKAELHKTENMRMIIDLNIVKNYVVFAEALTAYNDLYKDVKHDKVVVENLGSVSYCRKDLINHYNGYLVSCFNHSVIMSEYTEFVKTANNHVHDLERGIIERTTRQKDIQKEVV